MIKPKKSLGQNWLINPHILDKITDTAEINSNDIVVEVGPGTGNLTAKLVQKVLQHGSGQAGMIIAIEKDRRLIDSLREKFKNQASVKIVEADILQWAPLQLQWAPLQYKIVGNIPYYITSSFLRIIFEVWPTPKLIVLMVQKEVAQRIIAKPPHMNLLALSVQYYADPEIITYVSKNNFRPIPKVDSAIIRLKPKDQRLKSAETEKLFKLIRAGFSGKRKQLAGSLSKQLKIPKEKMIKTFQELNLKPTLRAENLSLKKWIKLEKLTRNY